MSVARSTMQDAARPVNPSFAGTIEDARNQVSSFMERFQGVVDRMAGQPPQEPESKESVVRGEVNGLFEQATADAVKIGTMMQFAQRILDRLEKSLP